MVARREETSSSTSSSVTGSRSEKRCNEHSPFADLFGSKTNITPPKEVGVKRNPPESGSKRFPKRYDSDIANADSLSWNTRKKKGQ